MVWGRKIAVKPYGAILVTGASSGLGAALAMHYARQDHLLLLWARNGERLAAVAAQCQACSRRDVLTRVIDLTDSVAVLAALRDDDSRTPIATAILAAGLGDMRKPDEVTERPEQAMALGLVNFVAATVMATVLAERMSARKGGQVVLIGSVAAFHALPFAPAYCGSKAGLLRFAQALRHGMQPFNVGVTLVSPGFIDTPMSRRLVSKKPWILSPEAAAERISLAASQNQGHLVLPWVFTLLRIADRLLPLPVRRFVLGRLRVQQHDLP
ncbi:SDR family NAD(P)-dependent oxidoreductase [Acidisoma cladoniae]|jgi:short-subunit dehydrogenase|uniref:SDR family NAD(P)-dependent oxidoreductase n=1 Tax=Acidisoma cladoniae TaxID=3040935 RepID=UPI00254C043D|nr:SDR family NAD(P)-dependent oxidoreductase [Acidisoma sp. PAMC 29798]